MVYGLSVAKHVVVGLPFELHKEKKNGFYWNDFVEECNLMPKLVACCTAFGVLKMTFVCELYVGKLQFE